MEDVNPPQEQGKPRIRRKAISYRPGIDRYDPNTGDWDIWGVPKRVSDKIDQWADKLGVPNGVIVEMLLERYALLRQVEAIDARFAQLWAQNRATGAATRTSRSSRVGPKPRSRRQREAHPVAEHSAAPATLEQGTPFMITRAMKSRLADLGYSVEDIREMTPAQARQILQAGQTRPED